MTVTRTQHPMPFTRVELCVFSIVEGQLQVLLGRRTGPPFEGQWALPGGVLRIDLDTGLDQAAQRVAKERLGLDLQHLQQQGAIGGSTRDPRAPWALSIVYRVMTPPDGFQLKAGKRLEELKWVPADQACADNKLAFDHHLIIGAAVEDLRAEVDNLRIPFEGLPPAFTLGELQGTCEVLAGRRLDKSSFRRRLDDRDLVVPLEGEFRGGANRPAQLYAARPKSSKF